MRLVRPYGSSATNRDDGRRMLLRPKYSADDARVPGVYLESNGKAIMGFWASVIDKIFRKPKKGSPAEQQRKLREQLGNAAWPRVEQKLIEAGVDNPPKEQWRKLWDRRIHPYNSDGRKSDDSRKRDNNPRYKQQYQLGAWYAVFAGNVEPGELGEDDFRKIAEKIESHLYSNALPFSNRGGKSKPMGRIEAMASAVEKSVCYYREDDNTWSRQDEEEYIKRAGTDLAEDIWNKAKGEDGTQNKPKFSHAASVLHKTYGNIFTDKEKGTTLSIVEAREGEHKHLFALHQAIKNAYRNMLKDSRAGTEARAKRIPKNWKELTSLLNNKRNNREINKTIRLGRVIHYTAGEQGSNNVIEWINENRDSEVLKNSRYWFSEGLAEIKRNEALVRAWRHVITMGTQTLKDWTGVTETDPLLYSKGEEKKRKAEQRFCDKRYENKVELLFGKDNGHELFCKKYDSEKKFNMQEAFIDGWALLRHSSFHFRNIEDFIKEIEENLPVNEEFTTAAKDLWEQDQEARKERLAEILTAAHLNIYATKEQAIKYLSACIKESTEEIPLPKFVRILQRAQNAWQAAGIKLPKKPSQLDYDTDKWLLCQYTALKLLYERAFSHWLVNKSHTDINSWIKQATDRATRAARKINKDEMAVARAADLVRLDKDDNNPIQTFMSILFAETAAEMRVQSGYEANPAEAKKQAKYIEDLRCDIIVLAFHEYVTKKGFKWLLPEKASPISPELKLAEILPEHSNEKSNSDVTEWMQKLYALVHLVPVEEVSTLIHHLKRYHILEKGSTDSGNVPVRKLYQVFDLYLLMHDAHYAGSNQQIPEEDTWKAIYEKPGRLQNLQGMWEQEIIPYRGLREMLRFGSQSALMTIFEKEGMVKEEHWGAFQGAKEGIEKAQKIKEQLHKELAKAKHKDADKLKKYKDILKKVEQHRKLKNHIYLVNHVRLHRLLMQVLARLVDYAVLWERDMYFILLALAWEKGEIGRIIFEETDKGTDKYKEFGSGNIVAYEVLQQLHKDGHIEREYVTKKMAYIRRYLAHFNMLHDKELRKQPLNLTETINHTRNLMSYDRKLKNAVSKSIIGMLQREGLQVEWKMKEHKLNEATIRTDTIKHFGKKDITEEQHGTEFVSMVAKLFNAEPQPPRKPRGNTAPSSNSHNPRKTRPYRR